jgi:hypothetical protein
MAFVTSCQESGLISLRINGSSELGKKKAFSVATEAAIPKQVYRSYNSQERK